MSRLKTETERKLLPHHTEQLSHKGRQIQGESHELKCTSQIGHKEQAAFSEYHRKGGDLMHFGVRGEVIYTQG